MPAPKVTVVMVSPGTQEYSGGTSTAGHMYFVLTDTNGTQHSYGFAPDESHQGSPFAPGKIWMNDNTNYVGTPAYSRTVDISDAQYNSMTDFATNISGFGSKYNVLTHNCITYTVKALTAGGINVDETAGGGIPVWQKGFIDRAISEFEKNSGAGTVVSPAPTNGTETDTSSGGGKNIKSVVTDSAGNKLSETDYSFSDDGNGLSVTRIGTNGVVGEVDKFSTDGSNYNKLIAQQGNLDPTAYYSGAGGTIASARNIFLADGASVTLTGTGTPRVVGGYGSVTLAPDNSFGQVTLNVNNESIFASKPGMWLDFLNGDANKVVASGAHIDLENYLSGRAALTVNGTGSTIILWNGREELNTSGNFVRINSDPSQNFSGGDIVNGSNDIFSAVGVLTGRSLAIDGSNDTGLLPGDPIVFTGSGTGNNISDAPAPEYDNLDPGWYIPHDEFDCVDDPVVVNLQGGGVQTRALSGSSAYFDMQNNGNRIRTGWGTAGEGYLVYDPAEKNTVTNDQSLVAGFGALAKLDSNADGILSSLDTAWSHLKIWTDANGTGTYQTGSLATLDAMGIASIRLAATHVNIMNNGNKILDDSVFTWKSGATGDIAGVGFAFDPNALQPTTTTHDPRPPRGTNWQGDCMSPHR